MAEGTQVGVAHPVVVTFNGPINPGKPGRAERSVAGDVPAGDDRPPRVARVSNVVQWSRPPLPRAQHHRAVGGRRFAEFKTGPAVVGVADTSDHTFTVTVDGMGRSPIPLPSPHHLPHFGEDGVLLASMGNGRNIRTPVGNYTVLSKERDVPIDSSSVGIPVDPGRATRSMVDRARRITGRGLFVHSAPWAVLAMGVENVTAASARYRPPRSGTSTIVEVGDPVTCRKPPGRRATA